MPSPPAWERLKSRPGPDLMIFRARLDTLVNPRTGREMERIALETPDWVNVIALTAAHEVVIVRQRRFGTGEVTTEIPGGMVDPGEAHRDAAKRELREETGFESERWTYLGSVEPNPAFHDNRCHHWLAEDAIRAGDPRPDGGEDILVLHLPLSEVRRRLIDGDIDHSLVVSAFSRVLDLRAVQIPGAGAGAHSEPGTTDPGPSHER